MKKKVTLLVTNNLEHDQRVNKVSLSLQKFGFDVSTIGCRSRKCNEYNTPYHTERLNVWFKKGPLFYLEINIRFIIYLLRHRTDIVVSNDTDTIIAGYVLSRISKLKFIVDLHELFPEVPEVTDRKFVKYVWTKIEDKILPHADVVYTVCQSIADYYKDRLNINPKVVMNAPMYSRPSEPCSYYDFPTLPKDKKIILYQGAVNVGRGIEWMMDAMPLVNEDAVFVVAGNGDLYEELKARSEREPECRSIFLGHIPYKQLSSLTVRASVGLCMLESKGLSYYYALPNRVFDLIQSHVPILAIDFPEIHRVVTLYKSGLLINDHSPKTVAEAVNKLLSSEVNHNQFDFAAKETCWEKSESVLRDIYSK